MTLAIAAPFPMSDNTSLIDAYRLALHFSLICFSREVAIFWIEMSLGSRSSA